MLNLYEELFLISIDDARGMIPFSAHINIKYGLAGAILADLAMLKKIEAKEEKLNVLDSMPAGKQTLDEALGAIAANQKSRKPAYWINALAVNKLFKQVAEELAAKGIIKIEAKRYLWVIPYEAHPQPEASAKYWVKNHLRAIVLGGATPEPGAVALLSLIKACRLLNLVTTKDERKSASKKVDELMKDDLFGEAAAKTLKEVEMAAAAAILTATNHTSIQK